MMKNISILASLAVSLSISACKKEVGDIKASAQSEATSACCACEEVIEITEVTDESIYQLESQWKDSTGKSLPLGSLAGHAQVIALGYTTCEYACPRILADMKAIEAGLSEDVRKCTHFTFISIDPERDTPERLATYRDEREITSERWKVITGDESSVQELAVVLGFKYRKTSAKDFAHSNMIIVLNRKGEVIHREQGLGIDPSATIQVISKSIAN